MKRILPIIQVTFLVITAFFFMSNRGGSPGGRTGSPSDGTSCGTNGGCHSNSQEVINQDFISIDTAEAGYEPGKTHTISVSPSLMNRDVWGFEIMAEDANGNAVGEFLNTTDANSQRSGERATHKAASSTGADGRTWEVEWVAPASGTGTITFYAASIAANNNGNTGGDRLLLDNLTVTEGIVNSVSLLENAKIKLYPNPATDYLKLDLPLNDVDVTIFSESGKAVYNERYTGTINIENLSSGKYFLKVMTGGESVTKTFVKM